VSTPATRYSYDDDPLNYADLHRAHGDLSRGTVVLIHGGFWRWDPEYFDGPTPLAHALAREGFTVWQVEYRTVGRGGGWPTTFVDIDAAIARLPRVADEEGIELGPVITMGHSAGGHLALWALGIEGSPLAGAVSLAGVVDLRLAESENLGRGAVVGFLGGPSSKVPERFERTSPAEHPVVDKPVRLIQGEADLIVPVSQAESYRAAATAVGQDVTVSLFAGDHFDIIDPRHAAFDLLLAAAAELCD
jgi:acetyl esterase/lipase